MIQEVLKKILLKIGFHAKVRAFRAFVKSFSQFDLRFSLEHKVVFGILSLFVSDVAEWKISLRKNLFTFIGFFCFTFVPLLNMFQFATFEMKLKATIEFLGTLTVVLKFCAILGNLDTFRILKRRITNDDGHFESEMSVELFYRKVARAVTFTLLGLHGCSTIIATSTNLFPFQLPLTNNPGRWINYFFGWSCCTFGGFFFSVFDCFFCLVTVFILSKIAVCKFHIKQIAKFEEPHGTPELQSKLIIKCVDLYGKIVELIDDANSLFKLALLAQLLASMGLVVVSTHLLLTGIGAGFLLVLASAIVPFFFNCFLSGFITAKCEEISDTLYCTKWYEFTGRDDRKKILMLLRMTQRPQGYSAGGFVTLGFKVFTDFLKQAYSYLMILKNLS